MNRLKGKITFHSLATFALAVTSFRIACFFCVLYFQSTFAFFFKDKSFLFLINFLSSAAILLTVFFLQTPEFFACFALFNSLSSTDISFFSFSCAGQAGSKADKEFSTSPFSRHVFFAATSGNYTIGIYFGQQLEQYRKTGCIKPRVHFLLYFFMLIGP